MGFTVYYDSTRPVDTAERDKIELRANELADFYEWVRSEPAHFWDVGENGELIGGSKPLRIERCDPIELEQAIASGRPIGNLDAVVEILRQISVEFTIDWEFAHDLADGPQGRIEDGRIDEELRKMIAEVNRAMDTPLEDM